ncbi:MAG: TolC family protein [Bacteroidales bacterium]|nr:TolC family protein [Bacteroidales bacterium]
MRILTIVAIALLFFQTNTKAQSESWSLDSCINYALENNIQIKQIELNIRVNESNLTRAKAALLPSLNLGGSYNMNFGTAVDPFTYQFVESNTSSMNLGLSSSLIIFNGLRNYHTMEREKYNLKAAMSDVARIKNDISLNIALGYLNILLSRELVNNATHQLASTTLQIDKTKKLVDAGSLPYGNLLEIEAQAASEKLQLVSSKNQLINARLILIQFLDLDTISEFNIVVPMISVPAQTELLLSVNDIYAQAQQLPQIVGAELKLQSAETGLNIARSYNMPNLSLNASYGSGYSSARSKYTVVEGFPVEEDYPYGEQFVDNLSTSLALRLNIPIFNNYNAKNAVQISIIGIENQRYQLQLEKNRLYKEIQQAYTDALGAYEKFIASSKNYEALTESFKYTQKKFDVGMLTSVDYNLAKTRLTKSESDLTAAKYEFIFKKNVLNFYSGKAFSLK